MIKRSLLRELKSHLSKKEMSLIVGPRQAGKTTLMLMLKDFLGKSGKKTVFLNLDIENEKQFFVSQSDLLKKIELEIGKKEGFVFIDEIQRKENAGLFLKGLYDMNLPYKFIVSGSGSIELKEKIHESLAGRKRIFELSTLSFEEFANFKTGYKYEDRLLDFFAIETDKSRGILEEYLSFGGYPRVVLEETAAEKQKMIGEIYQSYLEKDISYLLKVQKTESFSKLVRIMASQAGSLVNLSELSATLGISVKTVKDYLWYLEKTFVLQKLTPFFVNFRKEITKSPKYYFYDLGLRNYAIGNLGLRNNSSDEGFLFENFILNILKERTRNGLVKINFWRTKDGAEVDFIISTGTKQIPIEIKYKEFKKPELTRSLRGFIEKYQPREAFVFNLALEKTESLGKTKVHYIPFYKILKLSEYLKVGN